MKRLFLLFTILFSFSFLYSDASTEDTLSILNEDDCYNTGNCHYRFTFATDYYSFSPVVSNLYEIVVNVLDSENVWHNYYKTVAQCVTEGVCDAVTAEYIDFWFQHTVSGYQYIAVEIFGNDDDAYDYLYHDVLIDYCYGVNCGTGGTCDGTLGYPVCTCEEGYVLRGGICEEGWFEDENLAAAIVELLQYEGYDVETESDIDQEMFENIETLALRGRNISSLVGIELFSSLTVLDISENNISDLSPLSNCEELRILNMSSNPANDLTPLSNLPLVSLDVSYSGVYNFNPLTSNTALAELIFADKLNGRHAVIRPKDRLVPAWLQDLGLLECNGLIEFQREGNTTKFGVVDASGGCPAHGSCVDGICVCDEGYSYYTANNTCFNPNNCETGTHPDLSSGTCDPDSKRYDCGDLPENAEIVSDNNLYWNTLTSRYEIPAGRTTELCHSGDDGCENSICQWDCITDYFWVRDSICVPATQDEKVIPVGAYNQLILPYIFRQDVAFESIPGIPLFAPVFKAEINHSISRRLSAEWHFNLPRVEFHINSLSSILPLYEWDRKKVYVHMPWGQEEYSIDAEKKCFNSDEEQVNCDTAPNIDQVKVTYYPAPGQNIFSYIVLETTKEAFNNSGLDGYDIDESRDYWKITRYGDDGSVTEFERKNVRRPYHYEFMDYIPITKHITRDNKATGFKYDWESYGNSYYKMKSVSIIDPLQRAIVISSDSALSGLMGKPTSTKMKLYTGLEGNVEVFTGRADSGEVIESSLRKVARYEFSYGFQMNAKVYKNGNLYRTDIYSVGQSYENKFELRSQNISAKTMGHTIWSFNHFNQNNGKPNGYTETKFIHENSDIEEYITKTVTGKFDSWYQWPDPKKYSLSDLKNKTVTVYSHIKTGVTSKKRIVENYFTNWLQPAKKVTCEREENEADNCDNVADSVTEEIRYNVPGSPIYFKNADGQVTFNLYDSISKINASNYIIHFYQIPSLGTYINFDPSLNLGMNIFRSDSLRKSGTLLCSVLYSLDTPEGEIERVLPQYAYGINFDSDLCINASDRRVTNYVWAKEALGKPYDLQSVTYPDGKVRELTYDYEISDFFQVPAGLPFYLQYYLPNGKVWGEIITGSDSQNTLQTCYAYDRKYNLISQGLGSADNCDYKKGFSFNTENDFLMTSDYSYNEDNRPILENDYIYDYLGRKLVERNSAGVSTVYVYDSLDRVVFTFFGCNVDNFAFENRVYTPYNFDGDDLAGENGRGVAFDYHNDEFPYARYINLNTCEYYRKYKYDEMSNLTETYFFEYWGINQNNQIEPLGQPIIIKQTTKYDMLGRAVKSCQFDALVSDPEKRCIETEHDAFGNIVKKEEAVYDQNDLKRNDVQGEIREITYDLRNRPLTVTVDGLPTEQYSYSSSTSGGYFGYDSIRNKYENILPLTTYKDKWGRAAKQVDPFGNETETTYESSYSDNITSQTTTSSGTKTAETAWTYDDLDRKLSETRKQFIPGSESTTNVNHVTWWEYDSIGNVISVESSDGTKQTYSYDTLNRPVETVNEEYIDSNWVETSSSENSYDANGRLSRTETTRNNQTITEDYGFDTFGRVTSIKTTDPENSSRYRLKFYNTGGQVIWETDEESDSDPRNLEDLGFWHVEVGNEKYYTYNAFGDLEKTVYVMTNNGKGLGNIDINPWLNNGQITTNFEYDIFGRITSRTNDRSGVTEYRYYDANPGTSHSRNKLQSIQIFPAPNDGDTDFYDNESVAQKYTYTYDDKGDEASVEYEEGNYSIEISFTHDAFGRITGKTSDGSVPVTQTFTYNNRNLLETATDTVGNAATSVTRYYDSFGNPYSEAVSANNITKTVSRRMTDAKTYQFTYPDGKILRKTATGNDLDLIEYNNSEIASYSRANGVLTAVTKGQNLTETFSYNTWNQLANHTISNAPNNDIYKMNYGYSRGWHLVEKADGIKHTSDKYTYDSYYRLKEVKYDFVNNAATRTDNFYQDGVHNIEQNTENGTTFAWGVDKLNRLRDKKVGNSTEVAYGYDERNNMIEEDRSGTTNDRTYIYDDLNRLIEVKDGSQNTIATYTYDAFNRRITKTVGSTTERYTYDDWDIVEISTNSNDYTNIIDSGTDRHIAIEVTANNTSTLYYFLTDERGNVTALTDANGNVLERYRYRVYGDFEILDSQFSPKNCNNQTCYATNMHNFLWGGSLYEPETNLYWMRNRYYHIDMHRFINQDPIGIWGDANNLGNGFAYVAGMVVEASDPTGLQMMDPPTGITNLIYYTSYQYNIEAGKSPEIADRNASFARIGVSLYCSPTTNFFDAFDTMYDISQMMFDDIDMQQNIVEENPWYEVGTFTYEKENHKFNLNNEENSFRLISEGTMYVNEETGDELYLFEDGTIVVKSAKDNTISCSGPSCGDLGLHPSEPDSTDSVQTYFANQFIKKILEMHEKKSLFEMMEEEGPVIKYDDDGRKVFIFNPYYREKDPLKELFWKKQNADGTNGFVRNYFAPGAEYGYDSTTYEKFQQSGFPQTNVDPYSNLQQGNGFIQTNVDPYWY